MAATFTMPPRWMRQKRSGSSRAASSVIDDARGARSRASPRPCTCGRPGRSRRPRPRPAPRARRVLPAASALVADDEPALRADLVSRARSPNVARRRSRTLAMPIPWPAVSGSSPTPRSETRMRTPPSQDSADTATCPPAAAGSMPWSTAFSTSGCTRSGGSRTASRPAFGVDLPGHASSHAEALDVEVGTHHLQFLAQRALPGAGPGQRSAQQRGQPLQQPRCAVRVRVNQGADVREGV